MEVEITQLVVYPVKSCAGISLDQSEISSRGLKWDREWVVVDSRGKKLTQRLLPKMVLIQPLITESQLILCAPNSPSFAINLEKKEADVVFVRIWDDLTKGSDEGDEVAMWLSAFLDHPCRLLRVHTKAQRSLDLAWVYQWQKASATEAPELLSTHFGFADGFPFLICSEASLMALNEQIQSQNHAAIGMARFRPNIVIKGLEPYEEDYALSFIGGGHYFAKLKNCTRCPMPNVEPKTGLIDTQPVIALSETRSTPEGVLFGVNAGLYKQSDLSSIKIGQRLQTRFDF